MLLFSAFFSNLRLCHVESGLIYCRVETWPARSLLEALQQEEASILFSLRGKKQNFTGTKCFCRPLRFEYEAEEAPRAQCKFLCPKNLLYATHAMHPCRNMNPRHEESKILRELLSEFLAQT
jgi:hypothetical protein